MKQITYEDLLNIKTPVLIRREVSSESGLFVWGKLRILHPSGKCDYINDFDKSWSKSCFESNVLSKTISHMKQYDGLDSKLFLVAEL